MYMSLDLDGVPLPACVRTAVVPDNVSKYWLVLLLTVSSLPLVS